MAKKSRRVASKFGLRDNNSINKWRRIDLKEFKLDKPLVICLSGNASTTEKDACGFCKRAERMLELLFKNTGKRGANPLDFVDIMGCSYSYGVDVVVPDMTPEEKEDFFKEYPTMQDYINKNPDKVQKSEVGFMQDSEVLSIVDNILLPLCVDDNGSRLPIDSVCKNMSQVSFFTWCHGSMEVVKIFSTLMKRCYELGFEKDDVAKICNSCMQVSYAPITTVSRIPSVFFASQQDDFNFDLAMDYPDLNGIMFKHQAGNFEDDYIFSDRLCVYSSKMMNLMEEERNEHSVALLDRDPNWSIMSGHHNADAMSQMMAWALARVVENSIKNSKSDKYVPMMSLDDMKKELESVKDAFSPEDLMMK